MQLSGFNEVFIGLETPCAQSLLETGKTQNLKGDIPAAVAKIQSYGMEVMGGFIWGSIMTLTIFSTECAHL